MRGSGLRCMGAIGLLASSLAAATPDGGLQIAAPMLHGEANRELAAALQGSGLLTQVSRAVNARAHLPEAVHLRLVDCEAANAWYLPEQREVHLCLQLAELVAALLSHQVEDEDQLLRAVDGSLRFILLHEVGHALVDVLQLALTGREEDAVDQLAVWLLLEQGDGAEAVLSAATVFAANASGGADFAAAHALDEQRYFNMVCWVYGSAPARFAELPGDWGLPLERAAGCADEYRQLRVAWRRLLASHASAPTTRPPASPGAGAQTPSGQRDREAPPAVDASPLSGRDAGAIPASAANKPARGPTVAPPS